LALRLLTQELRNRYVCERCGHVHYQNPKMLVLCMVHWEDRLLMCRRALDPALGLWSAPAGFLEMRETLEEAAVRETLEEAGVHIRPASLSLYFVASLPHLSQVYVGFRTRLTRRPRLKPGPESLEAELRSEGELRKEQLAFGGALWGYYRTFFAQLRSARFPILSTTVLPSSADTQWIAQPREIRPVGPAAR
jgi:ADP-ribose pyrophosphatase YjhB (NUDIX family)